nr:ribonuclease H-like domain-containing protein [Tanacetum cinerariifolium]
MTILASLNSPVSDDDVVHYVIDGLSEMYNQVFGYIHYQGTFSDFKTVRSLLITEEMRLKSKPLASPVDSSSSSMVLLSESGVATGPTDTTGKVTMLPQAFTPETLHDPTTGTWNMDTGASYNLNNPVTSLITILIRDFLTRRVLLRCDSTEDLYPVTAPSLIPHAFLRTDTAYILLNVDDIVLTASSVHLLHQLIQSLHQEFSMTGLGSLNYFSGISVTRDSTGMFLSQRKYATEILERARMVGCNSSRTPIDTKSKLGDGGALVSDLTLYRSLAGSLQYFTFTRPDISYAVQQ